MRKKFLAVILTVITVFSFNISVFATSEVSETPVQDVTEVIEGSEVIEIEQTEIDNSEGSETGSEPENEPITEETETENTDTSEIITTDYSLILGDISLKISNLIAVLFCNSVLMSAFLIIIVFFKR